MDDPWNLTLDQSVFDDWSGESKIIINEKDVTDVFKLLNKLDEGSVNHAGVAQLEEELSICFKGEFKSDDVSSVLPMVHIVSQKLPLLSNSVCRLTLLTCKKVLHQVLALNSSIDLRQYFECIGNCLQHAKGLKDSPSTISFLEIIEQAYSVCSLKTFDITEELFKHSSAMLMAALTIIEQQNINHGASVSQLLTPLIAIGKFSCKLDAKSMAFIWKLVLKTMQQNPEICSELELGAVVNFLIQEVFYFFDMIRQNTNNISKLAKVAGFLLKVIIGLIEKDISLLENESENENILNLVFQLLKFTPDAIKSELPLSDDFVRLLELHVSITLHPILEFLTKTRRLLPSLLKATSNCPPENRLNLIRLLGQLLTPIYQSMLGENSSLTSPDLLTMFLSSIDQAHAEFNRSIPLHGIIHSGKGIHTVPLYELLVTQACSGMAIVVPASVTQCVSILLQSVIQRGFWAHLMACDILCFMARYGSSQFCLELIQHLFLLSPSLPSSNSRTTYLINRLVPLLSAAGRATILKSYPVEKYPDLWATISWNSFSPEQQAEFQRCTVPLISRSQMLKANAVLRLHSISTSGNISSVPNRNDLPPHLIKVGTLLFTALNNRSAKEYRRHIEQLLISLLRVLLFIAQPTQKEQHFHLMQMLKLVLDGKAFPLVQQDTADFLGRIGSMGVATSPQQPALLRVIANLFCETIASRSFLVHMSSLQAFEAFFKSTQHSQLANSCLREGQDLIVKQYISRQATKPPIGEISLYFNSQSACLASTPCILNPLPKLAIEAYALPPVESSSSVESYVNGSTAKRPRLENDEQLQFILSSLGKLVGDMSLLCPLPPWSKEEIKERIQTLNSFL